MQQKKKHECKVKQTRFFPPFILFFKFSFTCTVWRQNSRQASCLSGIWKINRGIDLLSKVKSNYVEFRNERPALQFPLQLYTKLEKEFSPTFSFLFFFTILQFGKGGGGGGCRLRRRRDFSSSFIIFTPSSSFPLPHKPKRKGKDYIYCTEQQDGEGGKKRPPWCLQVAESYKKSLGNGITWTKGFFRLMMPEGEGTATDVFPCRPLI